MLIRVDLAYFRRSFISFQETYQNALLLITDLTIKPWLVRSIFLYTKLFTGPDQFIIQLVLLSVIPDIYFTLYCPFMWIRSSIRDNWAGWGTRTTMSCFSYVRKPDPREEFWRKGYFGKKVEHVTERTLDEVSTKKAFRHKRSHLACEPLKAEAISKRKQMFYKLNMRDPTKKCTQRLELESIYEYKEPDGVEIY